MAADYSENNNKFNEKKLNKALIFQGSSGRIFLNIIVYFIFSLFNLMKKAVRKKSLIIFWRSRNFLKSFRKAYFWKHLPIRVLVLASSAGIILFFMLNLGIFSEDVYGWEKNFDDFSFLSEGIENRDVIKTIGQLEDRQLAVVSSKQCDLDYQKSQSSDLCGVIVVNELLKEQERKEEQARLAAERAREAARRLAAAKASARKPASFVRDSLGRMVCAKKNDKPGKSKENNKGKIHMDMECCLDPDEYPNPHCYYDPAKYGKYLK